MLTPIVCFGCGGSIGEKAELFRQARADQVKAKLAETDTAPEMAAVRQDVYGDCQHLFNILQVHRDCCRTHLATAMVQSDFY